MNIFFDIDQTLIYPGDRTMRPYAKWCLNYLKKNGHDIYLWSRRGEENCYDVAVLLGISLSRCFSKPPFTNLRDITHLTAYPEYCIDDDPSDVLTAWPGILVLPYMASYTAKEDKELVRVADTIVPVELEKQRHPRP